MLPRMLSRVPLTLTLLCVLLVSIILNTINIISLSTLQDQHFQFLSGSSSLRSLSSESKTPKYVVYSKNPNGAFLKHVDSGFHRYVSKDENLFLNSNLTSFTSTNVKLRRLVRFDGHLTVT